jgi:hypothetical protein
MISNLNNQKFHEEKAAWKGAGFEAGNSREKGRRLQAQPRQDRRAKRYHPFETRRMRKASKLFQPILAALSQLELPGKGSRKRTACKKYNNATSDSYNKTIKIEAIWAVFAS